MYNESMNKKIREGDTVSFRKDTLSLYGVVEKIVIEEDIVYYTIYANGKLYKHVTKEQLIHNYGEIDE